MRDHRWLLAVALFGTTILAESSPTAEANAAARAASKAAAFDNDQVTSLGYMLADSLRSGRSVPPTGWRRTNRGWERAEVWGTVSTAADVSIGGFTGRIAERPETINQWIQWDRAREQGWVSSFFGRVRPLHPIVFAVWLVLATALIVKFSTSYGPKGSGRLVDPSDIFSAGD